MAQFQGTDHYPVRNQYVQLIDGIRLYLPWQTVMVSPPTLLDCRASQLATALTMKFQSP